MHDRKRLLLSIYLSFPFFHQHFIYFFAISGGSSRERERERERPLHAGIDVTEKVEERKPDAR